MTKCRNAAIYASLVSIWVGLGLCPVAAQEYPSRNVTLVIPFPPGGSTDLVGRLLAQSLSEAWKHSVVVENRPGGNGMLGPTYVAKSKPDGHTLLFAAPSIANAKATMKSPPIDPIKDLSPVSQLTEVPYIISVNSKLPVSNLNELIALAKKDPGKLNAGWFAVGSRMTSEFFSDVAGITMTSIGYRGEALMLAALGTGEVQVGISTPVNVSELLSRGEIKALAVTSAERMEAFPDVPTTREAGLPEFAPLVWFGLFAPAGTPDEIRQYISAQVAKFAVDPKISAKLKAAGFTAKSSTPEELGRHLAQETDRVTKIGERIKFEKQ
jgi:tripartite-type tricarboxylate transporter receptor subunit TctC